MKVNSCTVLQVTFRFIRVGFLASSVAFSFFSLSISFWQTIPTSACNSKSMLKLLPARSHKHFEWTLHVAVFNWAHLPCCHFSWRHWIFLPCMTWLRKRDCPGRSCKSQPACTSRSTSLHPAKVRTRYKGCYRRLASGIGIVQTQGVSLPFTRWNRFFFFWGAGAGVSWSVLSRHVIDRLSCCSRRFSWGA